VFTHLITVFLTHFRQRTEGSLPFPQCASKVTIEFDANVEKKEEEGGGRRRRRRRRKKKKKKKKRRQLSNRFELTLY